MKFTLFKQRFARTILQGAARITVPLFCQPYIEYHANASAPTESKLWTGNHVGHTDGFLLLYAASKLHAQPRIIASSRFFELPAIGHLMRMARYISVSFKYARHVDTRKTDINQLLADGVDEVANGGILAGYPSSRISRDPELKPERISSGFSYVAKETRESIQPITCLGAHSVIPWSGDLKKAATGIARNLILRRRPRTVIYFGDPVHITGDEQRLRHISVQIEDAFIRDHSIITNRHPGINSLTNDPSRPSDTSRSIKRK